MREKLRVGVIGAGRWCQRAHLPGYVGSPLCDIVAISDLHEDLAKDAAAKFGIPDVYTDYQRMLQREDIDVIDVVTRAGDQFDNSHEVLTFQALEAGKHVLVEKPVCHDYKDVIRAQELADSKNLKTKVGLTFRYAPAVQYMFELVRDGFIGDPFVYNGYEQNSQWLSPDYPMDKRIHRVYPSTPPSFHKDLTPEGIGIFSLEGYGAPTIDIGLELIGSDLERVSCIMANMVKHRRLTNLDTEYSRINVDDADIFIAEGMNGTMFSLQSSIVTVGNYPGIEARIYGSQGGLQVRLVEEFGVIQTLKGAKPDAVEYVDMPIPRKFFPPAYEEGQSWDQVFYACLIHNFMEEIVSGGSVNQGNFIQSARVQKVINMASTAHYEKRWVHHSEM
ncbi:MAG: Gfo/Idh/MocA family oxidoreductase [Sphaerochaetaceae bacterium]|jgi:predicted dehydrogenase|nr:Gfo/Idh/MocA family oxidoreductase [Sphaerochaetaceae bacterium]MDD3941991.1 Gfo/Idh/MocA family oxidoreductase [Sphaerochaetaceae bacterium]MDX9939642.1 Gfo/Idh/MocA family oxidoreductase [Sphaerochaetaceae bacterium]